MYHVALALSLIALTGGSALYLYAKSCEGKGTCFAALIAIIVIILSLVSTVCTIYFGVQMWKMGPPPMMMRGGHDMQNERGPMGPANMEMEKAKKPNHKNNQ